MYYSDEWPSQLQQQSTTLIPLLFRYGPIETTAKQLTAEEREALRLKLGALIEQALQSDGQA